MPVTATLLQAYAHRFAGDLDKEPVIGIPHGAWVELACEYNDSQATKISPGVTSGGKHYQDAIPVPRAWDVPGGQPSRYVWFYPVI